MRLHITLLEKYTVKCTADWNATLMSVIEMGRIISGTPVVEMGVWLQWTKEHFVTK